MRTQMASVWTLVQVRTLMLTLMLDDAGADAGGDADADVETCRRRYKC